MRSAANLPARVWQGLQERPAPSQHILLARKTSSIQMNDVTRLFRGQRSIALSRVIVCEKSTPRTGFLQAISCRLGKLTGLANALAWDRPALL
ncbi:hypothetical protein EC9_18370 [Rosistilla ulvae]|uniref:Uncharacterized protein n=1 Tax=Rosistilla ulvae TaxID=1930277 RepID=A0A517LYF8_9BACT|nr:hypothetical protein EC9_18370 [Rosistilla ulvae]